LIWFYFFSIRKESSLFSIFIEFFCQGSCILFRCIFIFFVFIFFSYINLDVFLKLKLFFLTELKIKKNILVQIFTSKNHVTILLKFFLSYSFLTFLVVFINNIEYVNHYFVKFFCYLIGKYKGSFF
jgi:hypothetical protein